MRTAVTTAGDTRGLVAAARADWSIAIRAGSGRHRFIRIWAVVVRGRVFVRSWGLKPKGWYRRLLEEPSGLVRVGRQELPFRASPTRGEAVKSAVDRAYLRKYARPGEVRYARDLCGPTCRATTTELLLELAAGRGPRWTPRARAART